MEYDFQHLLEIVQFDHYSSDGLKQSTGSHSPPLIVCLQRKKCGIQCLSTLSTLYLLPCIGTTLVEVQAAEVAQDLPCHLFSLHLSFWSFHLGKWTITASLHREVEAEPPTHPVSRVWRKGHCVLSEDSSRQVGVWKTDEIQAKRLRI